MRRYSKLFLLLILLVQGANAVEPTNNYCGMPFSATLSPVPGQATTESRNPDWPRLLDWQHTTSVKPQQPELFPNLWNYLKSRVNPQLNTPPPNLCGGYFYQPPEIIRVRNPAPIGTTLTTITAKGPVIFSQTEPSTLEGSVVLTQPGREVAADKAILYRDSKTGQIHRVDMVGNVSYREPDRMAVGHYSQVDLANKTLSLCQGAYNMLRPSNLGPLWGWGTVEKFYRQSTDITLLDRASYTTCSPEKAVWNLKAKHIILNKNTGRGTAHDAWFYLGKMPIFYTPYMNFPIDKRRYSGFLYPTIGQSSESGYTINIPYYFNLAPNYDDTFLVTWMSRRDLQFSNLFRYLTETSQGFLQFSFLPYDPKFALFKQTAPFQFPALPKNKNQLFLDELANDSDSRGGVAFHNDTDFNDNWSGKADVNLVSDDYYLRDLGNTPQAVTTDQLLNQALINYQNMHWHFQSEVQAYQTLHLIDQRFVNDQYQRLPQMDLSASYPDLPYGLDFEANSEWVNFQHVDDFFTGKVYPAGDRYHLNPQLSLPMSRSSWFFIPTLGADATSYSVNNNAIVDTLSTVPIFFTTPDQELNFKTRTLPIFDIDSGLYLERNFHFLSHSYRQTLEPRVFYLYVPYTNQNDYPVFDTTLPVFGIDQLFRPNRFVGYDRLGDANQISLGLTSRILDGFNGRDKIDATIGEIYYFHPHEVCLYPTCVDDRTIGDTVSPVAGEIDYHPNPLWTGSLSAAYDPNQSEVQNEAVELRYNPGPQRVFKISYQYVPDGDRIPTEPLDSSENNLQRVDVGAAFPLTDHWSVMGDWNYNVSHQHDQAYVAGLEYDSCCVSLRFLASRSVTGENNEGVPDYQSNFYVQILLKGLGTVGPTGTGDLVRSSFPGYFDKFRRG